MRCLTCARRSQGVSDSIMLGRLPPRELSDMFACCVPSWCIRNPVEFTVPHAGGWATVRTGVGYGLRRVHRLGENAHFLVYLSCTEFKNLESEAHYTHDVHSPGTRVVGFRHVLC